MDPSGPLLTSSTAVLWLKVLLSVGLLVFLFVFRAKRSTAGASRPASSTAAKLGVAFAVLLSIGAFHSPGGPRSTSFVHYGEMFHYYLGPKYFRELGHTDLYNAVIVADAEQDQSLTNIPFYTDLTTYQNAPREQALREAERIKKRFSPERWAAFHRDLAFFKRATEKPGQPKLFRFLMDHGYNASPVATTVLGALTHLVPVTQLPLLASLDVLLLAAMVGLVFRTFGLWTGGVFSVYFFINILNDPSYVSGGLLRFDWLLCVVAAVCLLERERHAPAAALLVLAAVLKVFPVVLFVGIGVTFVQRFVVSRALDRATRRFVLGAFVAGAVLFALPATYLGSVLQPWEEFREKTALHDRGVYVNHLGLRGVLLFEPSHLSLAAFVDKYKDGAVAGDIVRNWQDAKERELAEKRPLLAICSLLMLGCVAALVWKRRAPEAESVLWPLPLIYVASFPSHYYYAFLALFVLLFARDDPSRSAPMALAPWLVFNVVALVTDGYCPSPIAFYTLVNGYLLVGMAAMLAIALRDAFRGPPAALTDAAPAASADARRPLAQRSGSTGKGRAKRRARGGSRRASATAEPTSG